MPQFTLTIPCEQYLREWFIHDSGGLNPVRLRKNSPEFHLLRIILMQKSAAGDPPPATPGDLRILIPAYRYMNPETYCAISERGRTAFLKLLRARFDLQLWQDVGAVIDTGVPREDLIYAWMETHGLELNEKNYLAVAMRLRRINDRIRTRIRVRRYRKKNN